MPLCVFFGLCLLRLRFFSGSNDCQSKVSLQCPLLNRDMFWLICSLYFFNKNVRCPKLKRPALLQTFPSERCHQSVRKFEINVLTHFSVVKRLPLLQLSIYFKKFFQVSFLFISMCLGIFCVSSFIWWKNVLLFFLSFYWKEVVHWNLHTCI